MKPRARFAPSPTGTLHIGSARTALFNWLFARHSGGAFLLRIEDTDRERSTKEFEQSILDGMRWLGMDWDEGLVYQSERTELYKEHVKKLMDEGKAYPCTCTHEELEEMRKKALASGGAAKYDGTCRNGPSHPGEPAVIRFMAPTEGTTEFHDFCRGTIRFENAQLDDLVIARSDGSPTYNFTAVVDDVLMKITHVIRGDDHINNTPRQVLLYKALGYPVPEFAHLPMIHGQDKKKLSKRHGATSVIEYQKMGFLPEAMINYLARLGWAHGDQEIFTREELIEKFDLDAVGSAASIFDMEKLAWVNAQHMARCSDEKLLALCEPFLEGLGFHVKDRAYAARAIATLRERGKTLKEIAEKSYFYFQDEIAIDEESGAKWLNDEGKELLIALKNKLEKLDSWNEGTIAKAFDSLISETGTKMKNLAQPVRVAMTGTTISPGIHEVLAALGKTRVLKRIEKALVF